MRFQIILAACSIAALGTFTSAHAADPIESFFGTWVPIDQEMKSCVEIDNSGEGPHFTMWQDYFVPGDGAPCAEAKTWMHNGKLRLSASCRSGEYGFRATTVEFTLANPNLMTATFTDRKFVRCEMPSRSLSPGEIAAITKALPAYTAPKADQDAVARKFGFKDDDDFDEALYLLGLVVEAADSNGARGGRHSSDLLAAVRRDRDALLARFPLPREPGAMDEEHEEGD